MLIPKHTDIFAKEMKRRGYGENTIKNYSSNLGCFFTYFKTKEHPLHINESDIKQYLGRFDQPNTQRSHHGAIKLFYEICLNQKEKFKWIPYVKKSEKLPIVLSVEEIQRMFNVCENKKHKAILSLLYCCGLRVSELINLKWKHLDKSRGIINILQAKGNKDRQVPFPLQLQNILIEYWKEYKTKTFIFSGQKDEQYSSRSVGEVMKQLATKANIDKRVYTHLMRHNSFTHMLESGIDLTLIQKIAGHSSPKTTQIYTHISHNLISSVQTPLQHINFQQ